jgi:plastocyanin
MHLHKFAAASTILVLSAAAALAKEVRAEISIFQFMPIEIRASVGDTVTWTNNDAIEHSVTSDTMSFGRPLFDTGFFEAGESRRLTFEESGTWLFHCARHPSMQGKIIVK